ARVVLVGVSAPDGSEGRREYVREPRAGRPVASTWRMLTSTSTLTLTPDVVLDGNVDVEPLVDLGLDRRGLRRALHQRLSVDVQRRRWAQRLRCRQGSTFRDNVNLNVLCSSRLGQPVGAVDMPPRGARSSLH